MNARSLILLLFSSVVCACSQPPKQVAAEPARHIVNHDLPDILENGQLIALTEFGSTSYFIYKGRPMGFELELLEQFADHLGVDLKIELVTEMDSVIPMLHQNCGDIIAANYTITKERKKDVNFSLPLLSTKQVLVQRKPDNWRQLTADQLEKQLLRQTVDLLNDTVYVRQNSAFYQRLINIMEELGGVIHVELVSSDLSTERLIKMVSDGEIKYTVADENVAKLSADIANIDIRTPLSFKQRIAWAVRPNAPLLLDTLNDWLEDFLKTKTYAVIYTKYFKARTQHRTKARSTYSSLEGNRLSPFDELFQAEAKRLDWDWKLLAAVAYRESRFDPQAEAWTGAAGLMQLIPETAKRFGVDSGSVFDPAMNIKAGVSYLKTLVDFWDENIRDEEERVKFILASYNVGLGHVKDAQRLAAKYEASDTTWASVAEYLKLKSKPKYYRDEVVKHGYCRGSEPVAYVDEIIGFWEHYRNTE